MTKLIVILALILLAQTQNPDTPQEGSLGDDNPVDIINGR